MKNLHQRPAPTEYGPYYQGYVNKVKTDNLYEALLKGQKSTVDFFKNLPAEKWNYRYAPEKWTIKEVLLHLIDGERIFAYRALRIARNDTTPMPGFDENVFVANCQADKRTPDSLIEEYKAVRNATIHLFGSLNEETVNRKGTASNQPATPLALGFITAGHELHHIDIIKERYL